MPAGGGAVFEIVTVTGDDVVAFVAASRARAVSVWVPFDAVVVVHETLYGADVSSEVMSAPSMRNRTPATPTLSAPAAETVTVPVTVPPALGAVNVTVGGVVSEGAACVVALAFI